MKELLLYLYSISPMWKTFDGRLRWVECYHLYDLTNGKVEFVWPYGSRGFVENGDTNTLTPL